MLEKSPACFAAPPPVSAECAAPRRRRRRRRYRPFMSDETLRRARPVIEQAVAKVFGVEDSDLSAFSRGVARTAHARQVAMYLAHVACRLSLTDVGRMFGRDRTTVAHACAVIEDARDDPVFDRVLDLLTWAVPAQSMRPRPNDPAAAW